MALLTLALLLSIALQGCAFTYSSDGLESSPEDLKNGDVCQDCTKIFELLVDMLSNADLQKKIMNDIESVCALLPGPTANLCKQEVEKMFPLAINFVTAILKPAEVCKLLGLCSSCDKEQMLSYFANEAIQAAVRSDNVKPSTECAFCTFLIKTLESLLPKERTESAVIKLLEEICHILPSSYRNQCETVIDKVTRTVLDAILEHATPEAICHLMHFCKGEESLLVDPCTLTTYRCRDIKTAVRCGTLFYCQKFAWKPLKYNTI